MQLNGMFRTPCTPDHMVAQLNDPAALAVMMPVGTEIQRTNATSYAFTLQRAFGPIKLKMHGALTTTPLGTGPDCRMVIHAAHLISGKVDLVLDLTFTPWHQKTQLSYQGTLTATGLASRLLGENPDRAQAALKAVFLRLKTHAERDIVLARSQGTAAQLA